MRSFENPQQNELTGRVALFDVAADGASATGGGGVCGGGGAAIALNDFTLVPRVLGLKSFTNAGYTLTRAASSLPPPVSIMAIWCEQLALKAKYKKEL